MIWAIISYTETGLVALEIAGSVTADTFVTTNLKLESVGTLTSGDKVLVARVGNGAWIIVDKIVEV